MSSVQIFAVGFGNLLMLGWLAAAAAPLVIHLWNRRRYREVPWAAMRFLLAAMRKNARRIQVEQWLLLAVRTLLIVLVVLAFGQPYLESLGLGFAAGQRTLRVLVLDGSYSMAYKPADKTLFETAKQTAIQLVDDGPQGDAFALILLAAPPVTIIGEPAADKASVTEEIANLKLPHAGADLATTLPLIESVLRNGRAQKLTQAEVVFVSDLGRTTWGEAARQPSDPPGGPSASSPVSDIRATLDRIAGQAKIVLIDVGQSNAENLAIAGLQMVDAYATTKRDVAFEAQVTNFSASQREQVPVDFWVDGRRSRRQTVNVAAGSQASAGFAYRFDQPGDHIVEARLGEDVSGGDRLDIDNHRYLAVAATEHVSVLCVSGKPRVEPLTGATDYLTLALAPDSAASDGMIVPEAITEGALLERDLSLYECVFLANVGQFTDAEATLLHAYVAAGGSLVFTLGDQVTPARYNQTLYSNSERRVLPCELGELAAPGQYRFDPLGYRHPLVRAFLGREQAGLLTTPVHEYFRLKINEQAPAQVALAFDNGEPALVEGRVGRGRVVVLSTEASLSSLLGPAAGSLAGSPWTSFPVWPSYVPAIQEILAFACADRSAAHNVMVGETLSERVRDTATLVELRTPDGGEQRLRVANDSDGARWTYADAWTSGVYSATAGDQKRRDFAVNVNVVEGNLARVDARELPAALTAASHDSENPLPVGGSRPHDAFHLPLLYGALTLLFLDTFLAWRFGHATR